MAAAVLVIFALVISPFGIEALTGRPVLTFRVTAVSWVLATFLLILSGAVLAKGKLRRHFFAVIASMLPLALLASLELAAMAFKLADRIAPLEDTSILEHATQWPGYLLSNARWQPGERLYRPWQGLGIYINAQGLRTLPPTHKNPGEWRIAVTGGSAVWGWRVFDVDTVPAQLQRLAHSSNQNVTIYNFGIEGATLRQELAVLKQFRDLYQIDQVIFYTGANDVFAAYLNFAGTQKNLIAATSGWASFELFRAAARFIELISGPSRKVQTADDDRLRYAMKEAEQYCGSVNLRCDFVLQPLLFTRANPIGPELRLVEIFKRLFPGFDQLGLAMYNDALSSVSTPQTLHDLSKMFDNFAQPVFTDNVHVNERGNRIAAERIAATISFGPR